MELNIWAETSNCFTVQKEEIENKFYGKMNQFQERRERKKKKKLGMNKLIEVFVRPPGGKYELIKINKHQ